MIRYPMQFCVDGNPPQTDGGLFQVPFRGRMLVVVASHGGGWDHVSVSLGNRCPNWEEMCHVKNLFWDEYDCVIQYHPPKKDYVNIHPHVLHLWRPHNAEIPMPPIEYV